MQNKINEFKIELKFRDIEARRFVNSCIVVDGHIIGDFEQDVLFGSFELSMTVLLSRLAKGPVINFTESKKKTDIFTALYEAAWNGVKQPLCDLSEDKHITVETEDCIAIPIGIESFDGEMAFVFTVAGRYCFAWRDWKSKAIYWGHIEKTQLLMKYSSMLQRSRLN